MVPMKHVWDTSIDFHLPHYNVIILPPQHAARTRYYTQGSFWARAQTMRCVTSSVFNVESHWPSPYPEWFVGHILKVKTGNTFALLQIGSSPVWYSQWRITPLFKDNFLVRPYDFYYTDPALWEDTTKYDCIVPHTILDIIIEIPPPQKKKIKKKIKKNNSKTFYQSCVISHQPLL